MKKKKINLIENFILFILSLLKQCFNFIKNQFQEFDKRYPRTSQVLQITFIYLFALIDLAYAVLTNVFSLGYLSESAISFFPFLNVILESPFFKFLASPEKVFFISYIVLEFMIIKKSVNFPKFIKYNILLVFSLLMLQGLIMNCWDLFFHREISSEMGNWVIDQGLMIGSNKQIAMFFFLFTFLVFLGIYSYFYLNALRGKIAIIPGFTWITDSVAFWLKIKTPTMKFNERKNKDDSND